MLRLTESLSSILVGSSSPSTGPSSSAAQFPPCPPLEPHLSAIRLSLLQTFARALSAQVDSLRRINGSPAPASASGMGGLLARATGAAGPSAVKDSVVAVIVGRYCELFNAAVALLAQGQDEDGVPVGEAVRRGLEEGAPRERDPADEVKVQAAQDENTVFSACVSLSLFAVSCASSAFTDSLCLRQAPPPAARARQADRVPGEQDPRPAQGAGLPSRPVRRAPPGSQCMSIFSLSFEPGHEPQSPFADEEHLVRARRRVCRVTRGRRPRWRTGERRRGRLRSFESSSCKADVCGLSSCARGAVSGRRRSGLSRRHYACVCKHPISILESY